MVKLNSFTISLIFSYLESKDIPTYLLSIQSETWLLLHGYVQGTVDQISDSFIFLLILISYMIYRPHTIVCLQQFLSISMYKPPTFV